MSEGWPIDLVLVRHGQSEGNLAQKKNKQGDDSLWSEEFHHRHTSRYRLTDLGREQALAAGKWIKENISEIFDQYYCSEYIRAKETAALLGFDNSEWHSEFYLREQDMGVFGSLSNTERKEQFYTELERKKLDSFYFAPPGGESIANCCLRVERWLGEIKRDCNGFSIITVCHGNILKSLRIRLERMTQENWGLLNTVKYKTHNCQIIHYSRRDPNTGRVSKQFEWVRSICPWDERRSQLTCNWEKIARHTFTNEDLLKDVDSIPRLINNQPGENLLSLQTKDINDDKEAEAD